MALEEGDPISDGFNGRKCEQFSDRRRATQEWRLLIIWRRISWGYEIG